MSVSRTFVVAATLVLAQSANAWNALGHKTIAEIAWRQLEPAERNQIVEVLRRHPRFDADFAGKMTDDVLKADKVTQDRWIFQHAAYWPDLARVLPKGERSNYDRPQWHYIDYPLFLDVADRIALANQLTVNLGTDNRTAKDSKHFNVLQAIGYCRATIKGNASTANKALAYCWLFHLVGDVHQPCHSTALFCVNHFPNGEGDRGGNEIPLVRGENLHSVWDNLLGRQHYIRDVDKTVYELNRVYRETWKAAGNEPDPRSWAKESHKFAESVVYVDMILNAVRQTPRGAKLQPIALPESYYREAGEKARQRVIAAGVRLGKLLSSRSVDDTADELGQEFIASQPAPVAPLAAGGNDDIQTESATLAHWLNTSTGVRHNSSCRNFKNTSKGRMCWADEGKPCGICGG